METQATLALSYFWENILPSDVVLRLEDGSTLPVNRETLSKCSEYFRFVWLLIWLIDMWDRMIQDFGTYQTSVSVWRYWSPKVTPCCALSPLHPCSFLIHNKISIQLLPHPLPLQFVLTPRCYSYLL
jgi:hypothetical protein